MSCAQCAAPGTCIAPGRKLTCASRRTPATPPSSRRSRANWSRPPIACCDARAPVASRAVIVERDIAVPTRDGIVLRANLVLPAGAKPCPVIMSVTPYGKDSGRARLIAFLMRLTGVRFGDIRVSHFTSFEAPDPLYWVGNGYAVM